MISESFFLHHRGLASTENSKCVNADDHHTTLAPTFTPTFQLQEAISYSLHLTQGLCLPRDLGVFLEFR